MPASWHGRRIRRGARFKGVISTEMIKFSNPRMQKIASGCESLELTEAGSWESFPLFAEEYVKQIGASVKKKIEAPDMHIWEIEYSGNVLNLVYDDFPNGISIEPKNKKAQGAVNEIYNIALEQRDSNGL